MKFIEAIERYPKITIFEIGDHDNDDKSQWDLVPIKNEILLEPAWEPEKLPFYLLKAKQILPDGSVLDCHMDMSLPERISDYIYFVQEEKVAFGYVHSFPGDKICMVPIDCSGDYQLFYSKLKPEIGIEVLRQGLAIASRKHYIAEDLGYILRDEKRYEEAIEAFLISASEGPSSYYVYHELADAYCLLGDISNERIYREKFETEKKSFEREFKITR